MGSRSDAEQVVRLARSRKALLGKAHLIRIDGPAAAGKTTLAEEIAELVDASVVHMDDLYEGWNGLQQGIAQLLPLVIALSTDAPAIYHRFDWATDDYAEAVTVAPAPFVIVEGVGSGTRELDPWSSALVWVDASEETRRRRAAERNDALSDRWDEWAADENELFAYERTREHADLVMES